MLSSAIQFKVNQRLKDHQDRAVVREPNVGSAAVWLDPLGVYDEEGGMIARVWRGTTRASDSDTYAEYVRATGVATQRSTDGNLGSMVLQRPVDGGVEVTVISLWDDLEAIRRFAGDEPEVAVYYPEDDRYLIDRPPHVEHHDVVVFEVI